MSYIGRNIDSINNISTLDNLSFNGSDATFNLTQNSVAFVPVSADALQIQIDGVYNLATILLVALLLLLILLLVVVQYVMVLNILELDY